jgi:hypothetical protein
MKVLVACEFSGVVRRSFRELGHDAWSCDLLPAEDDSPYHRQIDAVEFATNKANEWDLLIAHPPCTYLCNSGVRWLTTEPGRMEKMEQAAQFFLALWNAPIPRIAIENPIMHGHANKIVGIKHSQVIQPWMFGHGEVKATTFYLKNLPPLIPTHIKDDFFHPDPPVERHAKVHRMAPSPDRWKERSRTLDGIGEAIAKQWGALL